MNDRGQTLSPILLSLLFRRQLRKRPLTVEEHHIKDAIPPLQLLHRVLKFPSRVQELKRRVPLASESQKLVVEDVRDEGVAWSSMIQ